MGLDYNTTIDTRGNQLLRAIVSLALEQRRQGYCRDRWYQYRQTEKQEIMVHDALYKYILVRYQIGQRCIQNSYWLQITRSTNINGPYIARFVCTCQMRNTNSFYFLSLCVCTLYQEEDHPSQKPQVCGLSLRPSSAAADAPPCPIPLLVCCLLFAPLCIAPWAPTPGYIERLI